MYLSIVYLISAIYAAAVKEVIGLRCKDRLSSKRCLFLKNHSVCRTHSHRMKKQCPKTCQLCDPTCNDRSKFCPVLVKNAGCFRNPAKMETACPYSCGFCKVIDPCETHKCPTDQKCYLNGSNKPYCRCYIKQCKQKKRTGPLCTTTGQDFPNLCEMLKERCKTGRLMYVDRYTPCKPKRKQKVCKDAARESKYGLCTQWKEYGYCNKVRKTMEYFCPETCGFCEDEIKAAKSRVPSPPKTCTSLNFGCCWNDRAKPALGPNGEGCRACQDLKFCSRFQMSCGDGQNRKFMKQWCPNGCGYCVNNGVKVPRIYYRRSRTS